MFGCLGSLSNSIYVSLVQELDSNRGGGGGGGKRWLHSLDHYRRLKDEDPIIPFGEGPIISKWGAISRASRTGYHTTDPVQATACQGSASTTPINFKGKTEKKRGVGKTTGRRQKVQDATRLVQRVEDGV